MGEERNTIGLKEMKHKYIKPSFNFIKYISVLHHEKLSVDWLKIMLVKSMAVLHTRNKACHILLLPSVADSAAG